RRRAPVRAPEWASIRYRVELVPFDATTQTAPAPTPSPVLEKDVGRDAVAVVSPVRGSMRSTTSRGPRPRTHTAPAPTTTATGSWWSAYSILPGASATVRACREAIRVRRYSPRAPTPTTHAPAASAANTGPSRHVRWFGVAERTVVRSTVLVRASTSETEPLAWLYTQRLCPWAATAWGLAPTRTTARTSFARGSMRTSVFGSPNRVDRDEPLSLPVATIARSVAATAMKMMAVAIRSVRRRCRRACGRPRAF